MQFGTILANSTVSRLHVYSWLSPGTSSMIDMWYPTLDDVAIIESKCNGK